MTTINLAATLMILLQAASWPGLGLAQGRFYEGKTITVAAGTAPGGIGDNRVKSMVPCLRKFIPGNPHIALQYMDGGGGRQVGNHMFRVARPDGLTIGAFSSAVISLALLGENGVLYDIDKFIYLGSPESTSHNVYYTRKDAGLNSLEKLRGGAAVHLFLEFERTQIHPRILSARIGHRALARRGRRPQQYSDLGDAAQPRLGGERLDGLSRHPGSSPRL